MSKKSKSKGTNLISNNPNIIIPEQSLEKEEINKLKPATRANYTEGIIHQLFKLNKSKSFNESEIAEVLNLTRNTVKSAILNLLRKRNIYIIYDSGRRRYKVNGRIAHPIREANFFIGDREYFFELVMNDISPILIIREEKSDYGQVVAVGGIEIEERHFNEFLQMLEEVKLKLKSTKQKMINEEILL